MSRTAARAADGEEGDRPVLGIEQTVKRRSAGPHPGCHFGIGKTLLFDGSPELKRQNALDCGGPNLRERAVFFEEFIE